MAYEGPREVWTAAWEEPARATLPLSQAPSQLGGAEDELSLGPGSTLKHYEIIRELGRGGMGRVYLARDTRLARLCAIKLLLAHSGERAVRFLAEARATARCQHEAIVVVYEVDELRGCPYMVLEYLDGRTLRAWMAEREGPAPARLAAELMIPVVRALVCAHAMGIVHRDLKPENILLTEGGQVKVLDFGVARWLAPEGESAALAGEDSRVGTPLYMAPEQWQGREVDAQADLWAVGVVLHELAVGAHPLAPGSERLSEVRDLERPMPGAQERRALGPLAAVIERCLAKRREQRIGSARALLAALEAIAGDPQGDARSGDDHPFAGLSALQERDAGRFFGRERDTAAVLERLRQQQLVVVAGPSGAGKSSLVRAGLIPALGRSGGRWQRFVLRPGRRPLWALADVLVQLAGDAGDAGEQVATLRERPGHFGARLRAHCRRAGDERHALVFVDQFEELYTLGAPAAERAAFLACLEGAADDASSPVRVVLAVRSDFLDRVAEDRRFASEVTRGLVLLPPIGREGLRDALVRPVEAAGHRFEGEDLVARFLDELERARSPLPLLQFAAARLWEARDRARALLTRESYAALGGVAGALSTHADAVLSTLSPTEQRLAREILLRLVTPERTRAIVGLAELRGLAGDAAEQVAQQLAAARLVLIETGLEREGATVELIHESLIERWGRLRRWLDENEQDARFLARLRAAAEPWEASGRAPGLLWRDRAAEEARAWRDRAEGRRGLGEQEERYLDAVIALHARAQRRRRRQLVAVVATLSTIAAVVSYLALRAEREAGRARDEGARAAQQAARADEEARQARNASRMAAARELELKDPTTALALLRELEPPGLPRGWADLALRSLGGGIYRAALVHPDKVLGAAFSAEGRRVLTRGADGLVRVWDARGAGEPVALRGHVGAALAAKFSPDGSQVVTAGEDHTARVWRVDGAGAPAVLRGHAGAVTAAAWSPDGRWIVTGSADRTTRIWLFEGTGDEVAARDHGEAAPRMSERTGDEVAEGTTRARMSGGTGDEEAERTTRTRVSGGTGDEKAERTTRTRVSGGTGDEKAERAARSRMSGGTGDEEAERTARSRMSGGTGGEKAERAARDRVSGGTGDEKAERAARSRMSGGTGDEKAERAARTRMSEGTGDGEVARDHGEAVRAVAWSPEGRRIAATTRAGVHVWAVGSDAAPALLRAPGTAIHAAAWSPEGRRVLTVHDDSTARVWDLEAPAAPVATLEHGSPIYAAAWSPEGGRVVTAANDARAKVWRADGAGAPVVLAGHESPVYAAAWSPDGLRVATASYDATVRVWSADGRGAPEVLRGHTDAVHGVAWSADGAALASASSDRTARLWDPRRPGAGKEVGAPGDAVFAVAWSPDGARFVTASADRLLRVWPADGSGAPVVLRGHAGAVYAVAWSPDGRAIASGSTDGLAMVWSADGSAAPRVLAGHADWLNSVAWSPDGRSLVSASGDGTARVWDAAEGREVRALRGHGEVVNSAAWSPDGAAIATTSRDRTLRIWGADDGRERLVLRGHEDAVHWAAWSPDGQRIVSVSEDRSARVWRADGSGAPVILRGHVGGLSKAAWSPDGRRIATAGKDRTVQLWDAGGLAEPLVLRGHAGEVYGVAWSPDGRSVVSGAADGTTRLWTELTPLAGTDDPRLWTATRHCVSTERRMSLLGAAEASARADLEACLRRVAGN